MISETLIIHAGSLIEWRDSSGYVSKQPRRIAPTELRIEFFTPPQSLHILHKPSGTLLWHKSVSSTAQVKIVSGHANEADLAAPATAVQTLAGSVFDPCGRYLPRRFSVALDGNSEHKIALYNSPHGAHFSRAGGIFGQVRFDDGSAAAWALLTLTVTPSLGPALSFVAQADLHGEFRLPLERLPALTKDAPTPTYSAQLAIKAVHAPTPSEVLDPDSLSAKKLATGKDGNGDSQFANTLSLAITPGALQKVLSPAHTQLVLQSP